MTNYKEALEILKNRVSTLALNHKIGNRDIANLEIKDIVTSIETWVIPIFEKALIELEQAQKQKKLLKLYQRLYKDYSDIGLSQIILIKNKIKELENEV